MAYTPLAGSAGRIKVHGGSVIASITGWREKQTSEMLKVTSFESGVDANSVIAEQYVGSNIAGTVIDIEGYFDSGTPTSVASFPIGTALIIDFLYQKTGALGRYGVVCLVNDYADGPKLREAQTFTAQVTVNGVMPQPSLS